MRNQPGDASRLVKFRPARQARIDNDGNSIERQGGFRYRCRQHDPAAALRIALDRGALGGGFNLAVERQDQGTGQLIGQPFTDTLNLAHTGQEGEQIARLFAPGGQHRARHRILDPKLWPRAQPSDRQRMGLARAFDNRCITEQFRKPYPVDGRAHHRQPQIGPQHRLAFDCER